MSTATESVVPAQWRRDLLMLAVFVLVTYAVFFIVGRFVAGLSVNFIVGRLLNITLVAASFAVLTLALNLHWGYTGMFNIGVAGFMAIGVYTMAVLTAPADPAGSPVGGLGLPVSVGVIGGMLAAGLVGMVLSLPALRVRADYFAIITLGFAEIIRLSLLSSAFSEITIGGQVFGTGGGRGIRYEPTDTVVDVFFSLPGMGTVQSAVVTAIGSLGMSASVVDRFVYAVVVILFVILTYVFLRRVVRSPFGRVLKAIREDEIVAQSLGKDTRAAKIAAFGVGAALMGLGGMLWLGRTGSVSPEEFMPIITFYVFIALIIGGSGSNTGAVFGAFTFAAFLWEGPRYLNSVIGELVETDAPATIAGAGAELLNFNIVPLVSYLLDSLEELRWIVVGVVLIMLMIYRPSGLFGDRKEVAAGVDLSIRPGETNE